MEQIDWNEAVAILRCPISKSDLTILGTAELASIRNEAISGVRVHADGSNVATPVCELAVGSPDRHYVYRVEGDIAWLLPSLAIVTGEHATLRPLEREKSIVQQFYDEFGWVQNYSGVYHDTTEFTAVQSTAQSTVKRYLTACDKRIAAQLRGGKYLLDAGSGAIPEPSYSNDYRFRVCLDFSIRALREVKKKRLAGNIFVLGDLTNLPIKSSVIDDVISLHTIYHIPGELQTKAVDELVRVTKIGGRAIIVYTWDASALMAATAQATMFAGRVRQMIAGKRMPQQQSSSAAPNLYFHPLGRDWFRSLQDRHGATLRLWSATGAQFQKAFFREGRFGRAAAMAVLGLEKVAEPIAAWLGQYPMFVITKKADFERITPQVGPALSRASKINEK